MPVALKSEREGRLSGTKEVIFLAFCGALAFCVARPRALSGPDLETGCYLMADSDCDYSKLVSLARAVDLNGNIK